MASEGSIFHDFEYGINKVGFFLQDILRKEQLSSDAETQRQECVSHLQHMSNTLHMLDNYPTYGNVSLNAGLSQSSQDLNEDDEFEINNLPRSGSLPDIPASSSSKTKEHTPKMDSDFNLNDMRELVIYDPIEEVDEGDEDDDDDEEEEDPLKHSTGSRSSIKRSRKRDSAVLFDITLGDLEDAIDLAGFLTEKHSGKDWYCVLMDQHLCMFPSQDASEVAYDVMILPCCQICLDDRLMRTPVFRLTQAGMSPWVLVAKDNEELKEWINALTTAASGGKYSLSTSNSSASEHRRAGRASSITSMHAISEELQEENEEEEEEEEELQEEMETKPNADSESSLESTKTETVVEEKPDEKKQKEINENIAEENNIQSLENPPENPTSPETFGEDIYEAVVQQNDDFEDDGFATDEFESGSSENEDTDSSPKGSPKLQTKSKKKNQLLNWLKKKTRTKDRLFSSPQDGVALAGYVHRLENSDCSKRWCVVREGKIYCYKNIKDEDAELTLELEETEIRAKEEQKNRFVIRVMKDNERLLTLLTKNARDMDKWKTALRIESGFIKLTSPADTSSGVFEDDEGDYITPLSPVGLQNSPKRTTSSTTAEPDSVYDVVANGDDEDAYLQINVQESLGPLPNVPSGKKSPDPESLGPFPSIPSGRKSPDPETLGPLPSIPSGRKSPDPEFLGPLPSIPSGSKSLDPLPSLPVDAKPPALPPPRRSPVPQIFNEKKEDSENSEEFDEIYEEVQHALPDADKLSKYHKMSERERKQYEEDNKEDATQDINTSMTNLTSDTIPGLFRPPPLVRKVSFDEKIHVIPLALQTRDQQINGNQGNTPTKEKPQAEVSPIPQEPTAHEMRSLPRKTLKESWVKEMSEGDDKPKSKVIAKGPKIEQDKEREILEKTEEEFLEMAKALKEKGSAAVKQRRPSIVERNRIAFENRKREEAMKESNILTRSQSLNKEKADLLSLLEFQKKRVAVAKDRKIFFSFSNTNSNTAVADAEMEFHESQLGLAKAKKRIAEIDNELKHIELLRMKPKHDESGKKEAFKTKEFRLISDKSREVKAVDEKDGTDSDRVRNLKRGNVLSKLKVFENMGSK